MARPETDVNERNRFSIWSRLEKAAENPLKVTPEQKRKIRTRWSVGSFLLVLFVLLQFFDSGRSLFEGAYYQRTYNPIAILFRGLMQKPFTIALILVVSYFASRLITKARMSSIDAPKIVTDEMGDRVVLNSSIGRRGILTEQEERKIFTLTDIDKPTGIPIAINKTSGELINKQPGVRTNIEWHLANDNMLVVGPSGAGKTSGLLIGAYVQHACMGHGGLIFDPKGELYQTTEPIDIGLGRRTWLLNFKDGELQNSDGWDCLKQIREAEESTAIELAESFAGTILENGDEEYWTNTNKNLFKLLLLYVTHCDSFIPVEIDLSSDEAMGGSENYDDRRTWREFINLVTTDSDELVAILETALEDPHDRKLINRYFTTWKEDKNYKQIRSSLANALDVLMSPAVVDILSSDEIDISALSEGDATIYISCSGRKETYIQAMTLFVNMVLDENMTIAERRGGSLEHMLFVMLEEFSNLGRLDNLHKILSQNRSYNMSFLISIQTMNQLDKYNTKAEPSGRSVIESSCALQLCVGANEGVGSDVKGDTATYFSSRAGYKEVVKERVAEDRFKPLPESVQDVFVLDQKKMISTDKELVYPPDAIQAIKPTEILLSPSGHNSVMERKYQWSMHPLFGAYAVDRETGRETRFLTSQHIPVRKGGKPNTSRYYRIEPGTRKRPAQKVVRGNDTRTEDDFLV